MTAVRGNNDAQGWAAAIPECQRMAIQGLSFYVVHDLALLGFDPGVAAVDVVVSGHSHKPSIERRDGVLYINPGSAGPRRFKLPVTVAENLMNGKALTARIIELKVKPAGRSSR